MNLLMFADDFARRAFDRGMITWAQARRDNIGGPYWTYVGLWDLCPLDEVLAWTTDRLGVIER